MDFEKYKVPETPQPPVPKRIVAPQLSRWPDKAELAKHADDMLQYGAHLEAFTTAKAMWDAYWDARKKEQDRLEGIFWQDARKELGYEAGDPRAAKIEGFAWEHGHAAGLSEVWYWLQEAWDLVK